MQRSIINIRPVILNTTYILLIAVLSLPLLSSLNKQLIKQKQIEEDKKVLQAKVEVIGKGIPMRLIIPIINVDANIQNLGITNEGDMEAPNDINDVGWLKSGPHPGQIGSAVLDGHLDGINGEDGVFVNLHKLKMGDKLFVEDDKGVVTTFVVRQSQIFDPGYAEQVFSRNDGIYLNLITCDGVWNADKKSFSKRLVIFTDILI